MNRALPEVDLLGEIFVPMKFYWARADQTKPESERAFTGGIFSKIEGTNGLQPLFVDFDWTNQEKVGKAVKELQQKWKLGTAFIYASVPTSFHVKFYYDWFPFEKIVEILESHPEIDQGYVKIAKRMGGCVLRTCAKPEKPVPKFVKTIESGFQKEKHQNALDWGDLVRLSVESLLGVKMAWLHEFRNGKLLKKVKK